METDLFRNTEMEALFLHHESREQQPDFTTAVNNAERKY